MGQDSKELQKKAGSFTQRHGEIWKFLKFSMAGIGSTIVEVALHMLLIEVIFASLPKQHVDIFGILEYDGYGHLYSFLISTTVGYILAYIFNRKITFAADANPVLSTVLYAIMVIFTIFMTAYLGLLTTKLLLKWGVGETTTNFIAKNFVAFFATAWTYPTNRFIIHRKKKTA